MHYGKLKKKNGKLVYITSKDSADYNKFLNSLKDGDIVDLYVEKITDDATLAQLAKVHAMIRSLADITGFTFSEAKLLVKEQAGLCLHKNVDGKTFMICRSFGDCSKEELGAAIIACSELGEKVGFELV